MSSIKETNQIIKDLMQLALNLQQKIETTETELSFIQNYINNTQLLEQLKNLQEKALDVNLWNNPSDAGQILKELSLKEVLFSNFQAYVADLSVAKELLFSALKTDYDAEELAMIEIEINRLNKAINSEYVKTLFSHEDDCLPCLIEIKAGVGGLEAQDWADMLFNMYYKFAADNYCVEIIDYCAKDVGIDAATLKIVSKQESYCYGMLKGETGTHRLVRPSPFNKNNKRHTSFAEVFVTPFKENSIDIKILESDLRIDTYRASGAGGQHVNKTESAVRITHLPTGEVAQSQNDRSQHKNKAEAMKMLKIKLYAREERQRKAQVQRKGPGGWGQQIRSYVLDDSRITDLRTGFESRQPDRVLNGNLEPFLQAYIKYLAVNRHL